MTDANPLLILATVLVAGVAVGAGAKRIGLPSITGQILAGILIGQSGLALFDHHAVEGLQPITHFALGLVAVTVGAHLNVKRLRNAGKRLGYLLLFEALVTPALVFLALINFPWIDWPAALLFGVLAISTAPATVVALVKETRSKGVFVKTLVAAVAFNNMACILLFELARFAAQVELGGGTHGYGEILFLPLVQLGKAAVLGGVAALAMEFIQRSAAGSDKAATAAVVVLLLTLGLADFADVSPLLACLMLGLIQSNFTRARSYLADAVFADFEPAILAIFFTLAGMELDFAHAAEAGLVAVLFFSARFFGKLLSADWAMRLAGATDRVRKNLGLALVPQAGIAVGLVLLLQEDPVFRERNPELLSLFVGVVLTGVLAAELIGPITTRMALQRSGEAGRDRMRLIDFIHEENIVTDLHADSMEDAIRRLCRLMVETHHLDDVDESELLESVMKREAQVSTCLGGGLAVPHGTVPEGHAMLGVMGISQEGLAIETPDDKRVHCMVLLATPANERERHLQVLATLARTMGLDPNIQEQLYNAKSPAHAYEILHDEEAEGFNYFLED